MEHFYIPKPQFLELTTDIAAAWLEYASLDPITETDENGDERYTEEKQSEFCYILEQVESFLNACGVHGDER